MSPFHTTPKSPPHTCDLKLKKKSTNIVIKKGVTESNSKDDL